MKKVLVILAEGFEEIEAVTPIDVLRRAGAQVTSAGLEEGPIKGSRGIVIQPDKALGEVLDEEFDLVVLPGGIPGALNLRDDPRVKDVISRTLNRDRAVAAICAAPATVLATHGFLAGRMATCHPSRAEEMTEGHHLDERVVVDGNIITSKGAGTAMEFAFTLVDYLFGALEVRKVNEGMFARLGN